jgi:hypothetical protein
MSSEGGVDSMYDVQEFLSPKQKPSKLKSSVLSIAVVL